MLYSLPTFAVVRGPTKAVLVGQMWLELHQAPNAEQRNLLEAVLNSWFTMGRLGGFNAMNLQVCCRRKPSWNLVLCRQCSFFRGISTNHLSHGPGALSWRTRQQQLYI